MIIYIAENIINQKKYIGKTVRQLNNRKIRHLSAVHKNRENVYFHNAIRKYGGDNFRWGIICECSSLKELSQKERYYIGLYRTNNPTFGYNLTNGGEGCEGYKHSEEMKIIMSDKKKGIFNGVNNPMYGKIHSAETRAKISNRMKGERHPFWRKKRPDHAAKLMGRKNPKIAEETKLKMSEKAQLRQRTAKGTFYGKAIKKEPYGSTL